MATRKRTKLKLSLNTKIFVIIVIILAAAIILGGVPQIAQFSAPKYAKIAPPAKLTPAPFPGPYPIPSTGKYNSQILNLNKYIDANLMSTNKGLLHAVEKLQNSGTSCTNKFDGQLCEGHDLTSEGASELLEFHAYYGKITGDWTYFDKTLNYITNFMMPNAAKMPHWNEGTRGNDPLYPQWNSTTGFPMIFNWYNDGSGDNPNYPGSYPFSKIDAMYKPDDIRPDYVNDTDWKYSAAPDADFRAIGAIWHAYNFTGKASYLTKIQDFSKWERYAIFNGAGKRMNMANDYSAFGYTGGAWIALGSTARTGYQYPNSYWVLANFGTSTYKSEWSSVLTTTITRTQAAQNYWTTGSWNPAQSWDGSSWSFTSFDGWSGWQFWYFASVSEYCYYSKDTSACNQATKFFNYTKSWYNSNGQQLPNSIDTSGNMVSPGWPLGSVGAMARGSFWLWAATKDTNYKTFGEALLDKTIASYSTGTGGYFSPDMCMSVNCHRGWENAEIGRAMAVHDLIQTGQIL